MYTDIFSSFDPATSSIFPISNALFFFMVLVPLLFIKRDLWISLSQKNWILSSVPHLIVEQASRTSMRHIKGASNLLAPLFSILILINLFGLIPYSFRITSHILFSFSFGVPLWLMIIISRIAYDPKSFFAHLLPAGAPGWLSPTLVLIETVSVLLRPITLSFRLAANISAGHIILTLARTFLMSRILSSNILSSLSLTLICSFYSLFEIAICGIQAYIFCLLLSLYRDDHPLFTESTPANWFRLNWFILYNLYCVSLYKTLICGVNILFETQYMLSVNRSSSRLFILSLFILITRLLLGNENSYTLFSWHIITMKSVSITMPLLIDMPGLTFSSVVLFISANVLLFTKPYISEEPHIKRFTYLILLFVTSINLLIFIPNLICLLIGWDGLGLISFILVIYYQNHKSCAAGLVTAFSNRIGDVMLLISIRWSFSLGDWSILNLNTNSVQPYIWLVILVASITKSAQIPFSAWLPAAIAAPTPVSALVHSSTLVTAGVFLLYRFSPILYKFERFNISLLAISSITILMAGMIAITEIDIKKIVALSTLSQLGVIMFSLALSLPELALLHLLTHALFKATLFLCAGTLIHTLIHNQDLRLIGNRSSSLPLTASCTIIANAALCAIPFISGFYSKDAIIESALASSINSLIILMLILATLLTVIYSARLTIFVFSSPSFSQSRSTNSNKENLLITPTITLRLGAIVGGSRLNWLFSPFSIFPILTSSCKLIPVYLFLSAIILTCIPNYNQSVPKFTLYQSFSGSMWFLNAVSTQFIIKAPQNISFQLIKSRDQGWTESFGPQGVYLFMSRSSQHLTVWQANLIRPQLIRGSILTLGIICSTSLCLCNLNKILLWKSRLAHQPQTDIAPEERITLMQLNKGFSPISMSILFSAFLFSLFVATAILAISSLLSIFSFADREKRSPFECGFDPKKTARIPFSLRFFLLTILFLVFDIEIVLILPLPLSIKSNLSLSSSLRALLFMTVLIGGLVHEWKEGSLEWSILDKPWKLLISHRWRPPSYLLCSKLSPRAYYSLCCY